MDRGQTKRWKERKVGEDPVDGLANGGVWRTPTNPLITVSSSGLSAQVTSDHYVTYLGTKVGPEYC